MSPPDPWDVASPRGDPGPLPKLDGKQFVDLARRLFRAGFDALPAAAQRRLAEALAPIELAPAGASAGEQYDHYKRILEARGYSVDPAMPTVLAIRGMSSDGTLHPTTSSQRYDDTLVVLTRDANGNPTVTTLAGATHPAQNRSGQSPDVTGDGVGDVGMIKPGEYRVEPRGGFHGSNAWDVSTVGDSGQIPGWRDTDHDGQISQAERAASEARGDTLTGVLIHQGGFDRDRDGDLEDTPVSIGCVTLSHQDAHEQLTQAVGGANASMKLVVLDANG